LHAPGTTGAFEGPDPILTERINNYNLERHNEAQQLEDIHKINERRKRNVQQVWKYKMGG
jgi:hypothetical protein